MHTAITTQEASPVQAAAGEDFKTLVRIRRDELLGLWAAARLGLTGPAAAAYAKGIVQVGLAEPSDRLIVSTVATDLDDAGYEIERRYVWTELAHYAEIATLELGGEPMGQRHAA